MTQGPVNGEPAPAEPSTRRRTFGELVRYTAVGSFNTLLDLGIFSLLSVLAGVNPLIANIVSTCITLCVSFFLNRRVVFKSTQRMASTFLPFVTVTLFSGLVVQSAVIWSVLHLADTFWASAATAVTAPASKICAIAVGMVTNFLGYRWLFRENRSRGRENSGPRVG